MSTPTTETPVDVSFHLDAGLANEDPENYLVVHELMGRGQLLNAYEVRLPPSPRASFLRSIERRSLVPARWIRLARARERVSPPDPSRLFYPREISRPADVRFLARSFSSLGAG
jgi:hypothetical protein